MVETVLIWAMIAGVAVFAIEVVAVVVLLVLCIRDANRREGEAKARRRDG